jgi:hypothetical protein
MWVIGPTLSADKCFAYAAFTQTPVLGESAGRWSPSVYPTDEWFYSDSTTFETEMLETDDDDEDNEEAQPKREAKNKKRSSKDAKKTEKQSGVHKLQWKIYDDIFHWVNSENLKLSLVDSEEGGQGILSEFDSRIQTEMKLLDRMAEIFNPRNEYAFKVITDTLNPEGANWPVSAEQFFEARDKFYGVERQLLQSDLTERVLKELPEWLRERTKSSSSSIDAPETKMTEIVEQCEMFIDVFIGGIQRHIAIDELKMAPFASRMSKPELSYAFSLWRDFTNQHVNKAAVVFSVPRVPW